MKHSFFQAKKTALLVFAILSAFIFFILITIWTYNPLNDHSEGFWNFLVQYHLSIMIITELLGLAVGAVLFYVMGKQVEQTKKTANKSSEVFMKFLTGEERKTINFLLEQNGQSLQSKLSREPGMTRLKSHRVVSRLAEKGVIMIEGYGKTKIIKLQQEIYDSLTKE